MANKLREVGGSSESLLNYLNPLNIYNSFNLTNLYYLLNPKNINRYRALISITLNFVIIGFNIGEFISENVNSGYVAINCIYFFIYLYFINCITIKSICGLHTSFTETLNVSTTFNLFKSYCKYSISYINESDYIAELKDIVKCFSYEKEGSKEGSKEYFKFQNMLNINNLNTNLNEKILPNSYKMKKMGEKYEANNKYIFITLYYFIILLLNLNTVLSENANIFQFLNVCAIVMIIFIWTCVVNLPTWILILIIFVCIVIYLLISLIALYYKLNTKGFKIDDELLCQAYVIPFVNTTWTNRTFQANLKQCVQGSHDALFLKSISPLLEGIGKIENQLNDQNGILGNLSGVISVFQKQVQDMSAQIYVKLQFVVDKIIILRTKIEDIFKKIFDIFNQLIKSGNCSKDALVATSNILNSIADKLDWIGIDVGRGDGCFSGNTLIKIQDKNGNKDCDKDLEKRNNIKMKDGRIEESKIKESKIKDVRINDILEDGSRIIGLYKIKYNGTQMYNYNDVIVTGSHFVNEDSRLVRVFNSNNSSKCNFNEEYLYCLMTDTNEIMLNDVIFADYFDTNDVKIQNDVQSKTLANLNGFDCIDDFRNNNKFPLWAFHSNTIITMKGNHNNDSDSDGGSDGGIDDNIQNKKVSKMIKDIEINDETYYGKVLGIIKLEVNDIYEYNDVVTTGDQIIKIRNNWLKIKDLKESKKLKLKKKRFYHLIIENTNKLMINNITFTDFEQYSELDSFIDKEISKSLVIKS